MFRFGSAALAAALCISLAPDLALAQSVGSRGGMEGTIESVSLPPLGVNEAQNLITIDGEAEVRVAPTEIRIVLAVVNEAKTAADCQKNVGRIVDDLKAAWSQMSIKPEAVVVDFISVTPVYEWKIEKQQDEVLANEVLRSYRMQTNVHLQVATEASGQAAIKKAFELGVNDIIAFDYWSRDLDAKQIKARELALAAAREKADLLLKALFESRPAVINVQEDTRIRYPESLYHSFTNTSEEQVVSHSRASDVTSIRAPRPKTVYYRGLFSNADIQSSTLPMKPEISIVSKVRIYFESPAAQQLRKQQLEAKGKKED